MENIQELRNKLLDNFNKLKDGKMDVKEVEALNNTAGKVHQGIIIELKKSELGVTDIPFLNYEGQKKLKN